jgi:predicted ATP-dependent endonuclease of OLD family
MTKPLLKSFSVKKFRSLLDVKIDIDDTRPVIICGENNIGKTNLLRALNVFFNHPNQDDLFSAKVDMPYHIYDGSRGAGAKTELSAEIVSGDETQILSVTYGTDDNPTYHLNGNTIDAPQAANILSQFHYIFVESHNVNLPSLISTILEKDGLLKLDTKRAKQRQPLAALEKFIQLSQKAIADIEKGINECFAELTDFDGVLSGKKIAISFAEFEKLRDAVKNMTSITLSDGNTHGVASKGSGAQRAVFLALMKYIARHSKRNVIWGIDEPEAFLQPRLQKKVADVLTQTVNAQKQPVILTTHSQHFIDLSNLSSTYLFKGESTQKQYKRRPDRTYYELNTAPFSTSSPYEKAELIKKHLGINNNDGWELMPYNILVEGEEDKKYLETLFDILGLPSHNIIWSGGASKIGGYLQYYNTVAREMAYKPKIVCLFDNDDEGRDQSRKVKPSSYGFIEAAITALPRYDDAISSTTPGSDWEIEDFLPPNIVISGVNKILKDDDYKAISKAQSTARSSQAHKNKQILKYLEECTQHNNQDKDPFALDNLGRKKLLCSIICKQLGKVGNSILLTEAQTHFLRGLAP